MHEETELLVVSAARKLVLEVQADGPVADFPEGAVINDYGVNNDEPLIVAFNATDGTWQGVDAGNFVIVNEVPEEMADRALDLLDGTNEGVRRAMAFLAEQGFTDQYTTNREFYKNKLSPAGRMVGDSGIVKRDDRDLTPVYYDEQDVLRIVPGGNVRDIQPDILLRTYRMPDGSPIDLADIPRRKKTGFL